MATKVFEELRTQTLREQISRKIKDAILEGTLREGEKLIERRLAEQFGASLTSVREALIELELQGFVSKRRGARRNAATFVTKLSWNEVAKIFKVRRVLEGLAVEEAATLATPEQIEHITTAYMGMIEAAHRGDIRGFDDKDVVFHQRIWECASNEYLQDSLEHILLPYFAFTGIRNASRHAVDLIEEANSHFPILMAIKAKDVEAARSAFQASVSRWNRTAESELS